MILPYWTPTVLMSYIWTVKYWIITVIKKSVLKSYKTKTVQYWNITVIKTRQYLNHLIFNSAALIFYSIKSVKYWNLTS